MIYRRPSSPIVSPIGFFVLVVGCLCPLFGFASSAQAGAVSGVGLNNFTQATPPSSLGTDVSLAAGREFSLAIQSNGSVVGWGHPGEGRSTPPSNLSGVTCVSAGIYHALARKADGTVVGWGFNGNKILDIPSTVNHALAVAAGGYHSLALLQDGSVVGWGFDGNGRATPPATLRDVVAIDAGRDHSVALKSDGTVVAWGLDDHGQTDVPAGLTDVAAISAGENHTLALKRDGTVVAWGDNTSGQSTVPAGLANVVAIAAGGQHSLALKSNGTIQAWGANDDGQLNLSGSDARAIAAGGYHSLVVRGTGPLITTPPAGHASVAGTDVTFSVSATGTGLSYQWQFNGKDIQGANGATLTVSGVTRDNAGDYTVKISNPDGTVTSQTSVLAVHGRLKADGPQWLSNGSLRLSFGNEYGDALRSADLDRYTVQVSPDMKTWTALNAPCSLSNGRMRVDDASAANSQVRFYRVVEK